MEPAPRRGGRRGQARIGWLVLAWCLALGLASSPCGAVLLDSFLEADPLDLGTAAPAGTPLRQDPAYLGSPTRLALSDSSFVRVSFTHEQGLQVTQAGKVACRVESSRGCTTLVQRWGDRSPWVGAVRVERSVSPLLAAQNGETIRLDGRMKVTDLSVSRRVGQRLIVAGAVLRSSDHFDGAVAGVPDLFAPGPLTPVRLHNDVQALLVEARYERAAGAWQFGAERLDWQFPLKLGAGSTEVTLVPGARGERYSLRREKPLGRGRLVLETSQTTGSKTTSITLPTFTTGWLDNHYRCTQVSAGFRVPAGGQADGLRVALVRRSVEFSADGRASLPASLGGLPGDSLTFGAISHYRSTAAQVGSEWAAGDRLRLRAGVQYLWAKLNGAADYRLVNLFRLRPPSSSAFEWDIADGEVLFAGLGASWRKRTVRIDAAVARAFPRRSQDLEALLPSLKNPALPRAHTTGGVLSSLAVSRAW